jgi:hypothetical protein
MYVQAQTSVIISEEQDKRRDGITKGPNALPHETGIQATLGCKA